MACNGDSCEVNIPPKKKSEAKDPLQGLKGEARKKLSKFLGGLEPIDYDAPGTTVREQGV